MKGKLKEGASLVMSWLGGRGFVDVASPAAAVPSHAERAAANTGAALARLREVTDGRVARGDAPGFKLTGIDHLALTSSDMSRTLDFYCGVMGMRLSKTIALPGGGQHFFLDIAVDNSGSSGKVLGTQLAFFWFPNSPPAVPGVSAPSVQHLLKKGEHPTAPGAMNHVAFSVANEADLKEYRRKLVAASEDGLCGLVTPVVMHADTAEGFSVDRSEATWVSIYFFGPDGG